MLWLTINVRCKGGEMGVGGASGKRPSIAKGIKANTNLSKQLRFLQKKKLNFILIKMEIISMMVKQTCFSLFKTMFLVNKQIE